jgi:uncharacterized membrane protein required for colicin V production
VIELAAVFWIGVVLFGIIGLIRGWVREVQVTAAAVLGMFIIEQFGPWVADTMLARTPVDAITADPLASMRRLFILKAIILMMVVFFGYQGPVVIQAATGGRARTNRPRETIQEGILGMAAGLLNGYMVVGALWWYLHVSQYPFSWAIGPLVESSSENLVQFLPLAFLSSPWLEIMVVVFFLFVIIAII